MWQLMTYPRRPSSTSVRGRLLRAHVPIDQRHSEESATRNPLSAADKSGRGFLPTVGYAPLRERMTVLALFDWHRDGDAYEWGVYIPC